jgi:hypothetical protein
MASRVAARLRRETDAQVDTNRLWYPTPSKVVKKIQELLAE